MHAYYEIRYLDKTSSKPGFMNLTYQDCYDFYIFLNSQAPFLFFINDKLTNIEPGDIIMTVPGALTGGYKSEGAVYTRIRMRLSKDAVKHMCLIDFGLSSFLSAGNRKFRIASQYAEEFSQLVEEIIHNCEREYESGLYGYILSVRLLEFFLRAGEEELPAKVSDELISCIISNMNKDYKVISTVADLAKRMNYTPNYISSYFSSKMNTGLHEFIVAKKLAVAASLLISGASVTCAAFESGFDNHSHFSVLFKKHYGMSPCKYRKTLISDSI